MSPGHRFDPAILREYDIRGVVGSALGPDDALALGRTFGTLIVERGGLAVAVGRDGRHSSPALQESLVDGLVSTGLAVHLVGTCPSPALYFAVHHHGLDGGIMVTGSHNPPEYNGFKLMAGTGPFFGADIQELGRRAAAGPFASGTGRSTESAILAPYVERLQHGVTVNPTLSVVWDCGNGAAGPALTALCETLPGRHRILFPDVDGTFPNHHPDPTVAANLEQLRTMVLEIGADVGIAFDGDADRIGVIDDAGRILWGDQLLSLYAEDIIREHPGTTIIADVKASQVLFDRVADCGGVPVMWRSGHSLIKQKMAETGALLAGEMSGHIFFRDRYYGFDDALYAAVRLLECMSRRRTPLSAFRDGLPQVVNTPELRFACPDSRKFQVVEEIRQRLEAQGGLEICAIDGIRVRTGDGWWLLRASNTQDALVARCESRDDAGLERLKAELAALLGGAGLSLPAD